MKNKLGIYIYFIGQVASIVSSLIMDEFKPTIILSLIIPVLMGYFIWKNKSVFGIESKS